MGLVHEPIAVQVVMWDPKKFFYAILSISHHFRTPSILDTASLDTFGTWAPQWSPMSKLASSAIRMFLGRDVLQTADTI